MPLSVKVTVVLFLLIHLPYVSAATNQFKHWYPEWGFVFERILHSNCSAQYTKYLSGKKNYTNIDRWHGVGKTTVLTQPIIECILNLTPESIKVNMTSAGVVLGLTPSILAVLGSSTEETSMLFIIARRPLLALCLTTGSPAVFPMRSFEYRDPVGALKERKGRISPPILSSRVEIVVVIIEYMVALAAIANIGTLGYQLGIKAPCSFASHLTYLPLVWAFLGVTTHLCGAFALHLRARVSSQRPCNSVFDWLKIHFTPLAEQRPLVIHLVQETHLFLFSSWFTSIFTVCHVIYGTLAFSSLLFISVRDSIAVISRYMASVLCCRIVLMYELAVLREAFNVGIDSTGERRRLENSDTIPIESQTW